MTTSYRKDFRAQRESPGKEGIYWDTEKLILIHKNFKLEGNSEITSPEAANGMFGLHSIKKLNCQY